MSMESNSSQGQEVFVLISLENVCNLLVSIARFPEGDPAILKGQGGEASMESL